MNHGQELDVGLLWDAGAPVTLDTSNMSGWITAHAIGLPGFAGTATITFETANADPTDPCMPDGNWMPVEQTMVCGPEGEAVSLVVSEFALDQNGVPTADPNPYFSAVYGIKCWVRIDCRCRFLRAVVAGTTAPLTVTALASAKRS